MKIIFNLIAVGLGGFIGAMFRYILVELLVIPSGFPLGTLIENLLGCFLLGCFLTMSLHYWKISKRIKLFIGTGAIGSFTTFSTFSVESIQLIQHEQYVMAFCYVFGTIAGGLALTAFGVYLARVISKQKGSMIR